MVGGVNILENFPPVCSFEKAIEGEENEEENGTSVYGRTSSLTMLLKRVVCVTADSLQTEQRTKVFHEAMKTVVRPLWVGKLK